MTKISSLTSLVHEAFIQPLRSVLIVDDAYPTWEEVINSRIEANKIDNVLEERSQKKAWSKNPEDPLRLIKEFRSAQPGLVIDIHDAFAPSMGAIEGAPDKYESASDLADHLHQSDLLILDYNLEGEAGGLRGKKAREILSNVLTNSHFNLIIIHTEEDDINEVMEECLLSILQSCTSQFDENLLASLEPLDEILEDLLAAEDFFPDELKNKFSSQDYLNSRLYDDPKSVVSDFMQGKGGLAKLSQWANDLKLEPKFKKAFLYWAIREFEKDRLADFAHDAPEGLSWEFGQKCRWLRTSKGFVTFVKKGPDDLLGELQEALEAWKPTPSRLLSAKYRHALNSIGVEAEDRSLQKAHVFAQFYDSILEPAREGISAQQAANSRKFKIKEHVSRQSEAIAFLIEDELVLFGEAIIKADDASGETFSNHYGVNLDDEKTKKTAVDQFNSYVSTLPMKLGSDQLDSGHVFKMGEEWWVCATPACDLQPGQNAIAFTGTSNELRPFTALQLVPMKHKELENEHINSGSCCFIQDPQSGKIICLGLRSISDETKPATQKVTWRTLLAQGQGLISGGRFDVIRLKLTDIGVEPIKVQATIVTKLRYEYALNYIQRVGSSVSRIGLGYSAYPDLDK